ncbi:histidinol-phosphate transaminase [Virgibacillus sp. W0181]|uniref:histidinol-phosphate transaminase n=1 Tax=Virgibacillus sp. W0181 TaxID=3391581 RepID=UPI003F4778D2
MSKFWSTMAKRAVPYVPGEQLNRNILKLNTNENPYPPSPSVLEAINKESNRDLRLYPSPTMDELRESIAHEYGLDKQNVFIGNGSDEVLAFSFMAFFEPGKAIRYPAITYSFYPVYAKLFNIDAEEIELNEDFSIKAADFFYSEGGVIFPNPNAPTSIFLPLDEVERIVKKNPNTVVIFDEAYVDFAEESAVSLVSKYENLLVIQTMSKSRSLAGLRIGFALGNEHLIEALIRMKDSFNSYPVDRLAMAGAKAAIEDTSYFQQTTKKIITTREWVSEKLKQLGFYVLPSQTNFIFARHETITAETIYSSLKAADVLVRYFGKKPIDNYLRITIGTDEEMEVFFKKLSMIVDK